MANYIERVQGHPGYHGVLNMQDAMRMAVENVEFSNELRQNPEKYQSTFNLSDAAVAVLRNITQEELEQIRELAGDNKEGFSSAMGAAEQILARHAAEIGEEGLQMASAEVYAETTV